MKYLLLNKYFKMTLCRIILVLFIPLCVCAYQPWKEEIVFDQKQVKYYPRPGHIPLLNRKIVRGVRVSILEHPYVVSIRRLTSHYLTGTLLNEATVLTVALPLLGWYTRTGMLLRYVRVPLYELNVVAGENYSDRGSMLHTVVAVVVPSEFNQYSLRANLALLVIHEKLQLKATIKGISLMSNHVLNATIRYGFVTGWGRCEITGAELCLPRSTKFYPDEWQDPMLKTISVNVTAPSNYCDAYTNHQLRLLEDTMCFGEARQKKRASCCLAVPGAPLVVHGQLLGLLSWGFGCGYAYDMPLIYLNVTYYHDWLTHNMGVISQISESSLKLAYEATQAASILYYLRGTRLYPIEEIIQEQKHSPNELIPTPLDFCFAAMKGDVWDLRDFIADGIYKQGKAKMHGMIKDAMAPNSTRSCNIPMDLDMKKQIEAF